MLEAMKNANLVTEDQAKEVERKKAAQAKAERERKEESTDKYEEN
jgi:hypothetical protein